MEQGRLTLAPTVSVRERLEYRGAAGRNRRCRDPPYGDAYGLIKGVFTGTIMLRFA